jgi:hypothetical protein
LQRTPSHGVPLPHTNFHGSASSLGTRALISASHAYSVCIALRLGRSIHEVCPMCPVHVGLCENPNRSFSLIVSMRFPCALLTIPCVELCDLILNILKIFFRFPGIMFPRKLFSTHEKHALIVRFACFKHAIHKPFFLVVDLDRFKWLLPFSPLIRL